MLRWHHHHHHPHKHHHHHQQHLPQHQPHQHDDDCDQIDFRPPVHLGLPHALASLVTAQSLFRDNHARSDCDIVSHHYDHGQDPISFTFNYVRLLL